MPHSVEDKKRAITRLRRIKGQAEALERAVADGVQCGPMLRQFAAMRGAINGLMADVLEGHLLESFGHADCPITDIKTNPDHERIHDTIDEAVTLIRSYLK